MLKFVKISFICLIIFACGLFGVKVYTGNGNSQLEFLHDVDATVTATTPSKYDLRDYIDIGVESQHTLGICYAFASLTSLETYLALNYGEYYDFSELHFATSLCLKDNYYSSINDALINGGNFAHFSLYTQKDTSLVLEDEMPMSKYINLSSSTRANRLANDFNTIEQNYYPIVKVNDTKSYPQYAGNKSQYSSSELTNFRYNIKNHIINYGSLTAGIYTDTSIFKNSTINYKVTDDSLVTSQSEITSNINHLVSIIGWDDEYNANGTWTNPGAYICLNSWGTQFGEGGYFYVSYDDYFIESTIQGVSNATLSTTNNKISTISAYQNKTSIFNHVFTQSKPTVYTANIINTSNHIGEKINYIDSFIKGSNTKFYIKFFNSKSQALANINNVNTYVNSSKIDDYTLYSKYSLSTPLNITNNYMVIIREVIETTKTHSLGGNESDNLNIEPCYYNGSGLGTFDLVEDIWDPTVSDRSLDCTLPLILHLETANIEVAPFKDTVEPDEEDKHIKNNSIFKNKTIKLNLTNANLTQSIINNIKITKLLKNSFYNVTSNFSISLQSSNSITITMVGDLSSTLNVGNYLISIPCANTTIYRVVEIQNSANYSITYFLDGGTAHNPTIYNNNQTSLHLNNPVKPGFDFVGWYTNSTLTSPFNPNSLPYTNLILYAKYDIARPTISSKSNDVTVTYYDGINVTINITATHYFENTYNTLSYQWYYRADIYSAFTPIAGATSTSLSLNRVAQSGYYACEVTINITDTNLSITPCAKVLSASQDNAILVNIKPFIYDTSDVKWNYTEAFSYDTKMHKVELINLPSNITVSYTNNEYSNIGTYTAHATISYDDMGGNAIVSPIEDLTWQIRKAKITITINNIISDTQLSNETLNSMYSCEIENEYLPENIDTLTEKIEYLNINYKLNNTLNSCIKIITATTHDFEIYEIIVKDGEYRITIKSLSDNNITTTSNKGFAQNCVFTTLSHELSKEEINLLNDKNLTAVNSYSIKYSYLFNETATINIPIEKSIITNNISVYMLKDGKLTKLDSVCSSQGVTFTTTQQDATYIVAINDNSKTSNAEMIVLIAIICIYSALCVYAIINGIKHKHDYY